MTNNAGHGRIQARYGLTGPACPDAWVAGCSRTPDRLTGLGGQETGAARLPAGRLRKDEHGAATVR